jgi:hypothetical protein
MSSTFIKAALHALSPSLGDMCKRTIGSPLSWDIWCQDLTFLSPSVLGFCGPEAKISFSSCLHRNNKIFAIMTFVPRSWDNDTLMESALFPTFDLHFFILHVVSS